MITTNSNRRSPARRSLTAAFLLLITLPLSQPAHARAENSPHPTIEGLTGEALFSKLIEHNRLREKLLRQYTVARTYAVKTSKGKVRAESQVLTQYRAPDTKEFTILSEKGSRIVRGRVFKPLMESEAEAAAGTNHRDSSITPKNYTFELLGEEDLDGYHTFVVQATPARKDKYLFKGKIWIEAGDFAIAKIEAQPAKNPSFWTKRVNVVRRYQKLGEFWLPLRDETVSEIRIFGANILTIDYENYEIHSSADSAKNESPRGF